MDIKIGSENYSDEELSKLSSRQLDQIYESLKVKTREVYQIMGERMIDENKETYLREWADLAGLSDSLTKFFLDYANLNDFILENGYYHYISKYGAEMTFQVWSCRWLLEKKGDYVSFLKKPELDHLKLHRKTVIRMEDLERMDRKDPQAIEALTEYVIYKAVEKKPYILCITKDNKLFSGKVNRHFTMLDRVPR